VHTLEFQNLASAAEIYLGLRHFVLGLSGITALCLGPLYMDVFTEALILLPDIV
jgi:hypothetical protein